MKLFYCYKMLLTSFYPGYSIYSSYNSLNGKPLVEKAPQTHEPKHIKWDIFFFDFNSLEDIINILT